MDRNQETSRKLDAMWNDLSEKAREVIATTDMWVIDELFGNLDTPEEVNKFIEEEWSDNDKEVCEDCLHDHLRCRTLD